LVSLRSDFIYEPDQIVDLDLEQRLVAKREEIVMGWLVAGLGDGEFDATQKIRPPHFPVPFGCRSQRPAFGLLEFMSSFAYQEQRDDNIVHFSRGQRLLV